MKTEKQTPTTLSPSELSKLKAKIAENTKALKELNTANAT